MQLFPKWNLCGKVSNATFLCLNDLEAEFLDYSLVNRSKIHQDILEYAFVKESDLMCYQIDANWTHLSARNPDGMLRFSKITLIANCDHYSTTLMLRRKEFLV